MPASRSQRRRQPVRNQSSARSTQPRRPAARTSEPPDYSLDYAYVRRDLLRILLWGGLLFAGMIATWLII